MSLIAKLFRLLIDLACLPFWLLQGLSPWVAYPLAGVAILPVVDTIWAVPGGFILTSIGVVIVHGWPEITRDFANWRDRPQPDTPEEARARERAVEFWLESIQALEARVTDRLVSANTVEDVHAVLEMSRREEANGDMESYGSNGSPVIRVVAEHATVLDDELIDEFVSAHHTDYLAKNKSLTREQVARVAWKLIPKCPVYDPGSSTKNLAQQFGYRNPLKQLIATHGLTASDSIARELYAYAMGFGTVPVSPVEGAYSYTSFTPRYAAEMLKYFPGWLPGWADSLARAHPPAPPRPQPVERGPIADAAVTVVEGVLAVVIFAPLFIWLWIEEAWSGN